MQILLACAKIIKDCTTSLPIPATRPVFQKEAEHTAAEMASMSVAELAKALKCSAPIATQTKQRYEAFFDMGERVPAGLAYFGQAYKYLRAESFDKTQFAYAATHLWHTSFLYGLLRPTDLIHPYRMEGKVKTQYAHGLTQFDFWKDRLTNFLIDSVKADDGILIHLATEEMEHLFHWKEVKAAVRVVQPQFLVRKGDALKVVTVYAKSCRGGMARHLITQAASTPDTLFSYEEEGFLYNPSLSTPEQPLFILD